jgi:hypothetical protein
LALVREGITDNLKDQREDKLSGWWNQGDMTDLLREDLVADIGEQAATEILLYLE